MIHRPRERGAALLLTFLAILVLTVVIAQLNVSSRVEHDLAMNSLNEVQFDYAGRAGLEAAKALLIGDERDEQMDSQAGADGAGGAGGAGGGGGQTTMNGPGGNSGSFGNMGGDSNAEGGGGDDQAPNDSIKDKWAGEGETREQFGDVEVRLRVVDEDRKFNLLTLVARDEDYRELSTQRFIRLVDTFREGTRSDVQAGDASDLAKRLVDWFEGKREDKFPNPPLHLQEKEGDKNDSMVFSKARFQDEKVPPIVFPLGLDELLEIEGVTDQLLHGYMEDGRYVPGLEDVVTVYSNLVFDQESYQPMQEADAAKRGEEKGSNDAGFQSPFQKGDQDSESSSGKSGSKSGGKGKGGKSAGAGAGGGGDSGGEKSSGDGGEGAADENQNLDDSGQLMATETNQGRINVNTAPLCVLRCLVEEKDLPYAVLEKLDEFRRCAVDDSLLTKNGFKFGSKKKSSDSDKDKKGKSGSGGSGGSSGSSGLGALGADEEDEEQDFSFHSTGDVIDKVQDYYDTQFDVGDAAKQEFGDALAVKSHVFTIYVQMRAKQSNRSSSLGSDRGPPDRVFQAVVWRRSQGEGQNQVLTLVPLHNWIGTSPPDDEDYRRKLPFGF